MTLVLVEPAQGASLLSNPGFESSPVGETTSFPGWHNYGSHAYGETSATMAHGGTNYLKVYQQFSHVTNFTGIFQDYVTVPGGFYQADGWAYTLANDQLAGQNAAWIEVTFRDSKSDILGLYRSSPLTTNAISDGNFPLNTWVNLPVTNQFDPVNYELTGTVRHLLAPPGTSFLRYQVIFQGDVAGSLGSVFFDDLGLTQTGGRSDGGGNLLWCDEFSQPDGSVPQAVNWAYDLGGGGWGNRELQKYTDSTNNIRVEAGQLVIEARREIHGGKTNYTSGRLLTKGKRSWTYGRIEARIKIPRGQGIWPAFWMLGTNIDSVHWPACGEIDIMENIGKEPGRVHGTVHGPGYSGNGGIGGPFFLPGNAAFADDFHLFAIECRSNHITWFVDGEPYFELDPASLPEKAQWVFNEPKFILLNLAVGGNWPGYPNVSTAFPQRMLVDYVRVYDQEGPTRPAQPSSLRISN